MIAENAKGTHSAPPRMLAGLLGLMALFAFAGSLFAQVPQNLYYKFNEGTGTTTANDASPGAGSPTLNLNTGNSWTSPGRLGASAMNFAAGGQIATGYAAVLTNNDSFTVEFWIRGAATSALGYITGDDASGGLRIFTGGVAGAGGILWQTASGFSATGVTTGVFDGTWHHVAFVFDGTAKTLTLYVDGVLGDQSNNQTSAVVNGVNWYIGGHTATASTFIGSMDEFRFWNVARSQAEIQAGMNVELPLTDSTSLNASSTGGSLTTPVSNHVAMNLLAATFIGNNSLNSVTLTQTGTITDAELNSVALWRDVNANDVVDSGTDVQLDTGSLSGGSITFAGAPLQALTAGSPVRLLLAVNISSALTPGTTISFNVISASWSGGTDLTSYPAVGGTWTVLHPNLPSLMYYKFNEGAGTTTANSAIPGVGNPNPTFSLSTGWEVPGKLGASALDLKVGTGSVGTGYLDSGWPLQLPSSTSVTIEFWAKRNVANATTTQYICGDTGAASFRIYTTGTQILVVGGGFSTLSSPSGAVPVNDGNWHHVAFVYDASAHETYLYVDGIVRASAINQTSNFNSTSTTQGFLVGHYAAATTTRFDGDIDEFRFWARARTAGEVQAMANFELPPPNSVLLLPSTSGGTVSTPATDVVVLGMGAYTFTNNNDINSLTLTRSGTISDAQISAVKLYRDNNANGSVDGSDTLLATGALTGGEVTLSGTPLQALSTSAPTALLVAVDIPSAVAPGSSVSFSIDSASDASFSGGSDQTSYPLSGGNYLVAFTGNLTINQTSGDFTDIGAAFDALETFGVAGPVTLTITDSATYVSTPSYSLGIDNATPVPGITPVQGVSATNTITLRAAAGQSPKIQGNSSGAILFGQSTATALTGRGGLVINQSYVTVEGLEVFGGPNFGIIMQGNQTYSLSTTDITIRRCVVHDIPDGPGIAFMGQNSGFFVNGVIENNFVYNCFTNSGNPTSSGVLLVNTGGSITIRNAASASGIVRHNTIVHTSTFTNTGAIYAYSSSTTYALNEISNNIIVCTDAAVPAIYLSSVTSAPTIANCNFNYWFANTHCNQATLTPFATWQGTGRDANGSNLDPMLLNTGAPFDLRLHPASPCIDPAGQTSTIGDDVFGTVRPKGTGVDIGAHEADWSPELLVGANSAGPAAVTMSLAADQWIGSFNAMSVLSTQTVNSVMLTHTGSFAPTGYSNLKLWVDNNANNQLDAGDIQLGSTVASLSGSTVTFSGAPLGAFTAQNQALVFFLSAQIAAGQTPGTAQFQITLAGDISAAPGPVAGNFPVVGKSINVENPVSTLVPSVGSGFNAGRVYTGLQNIALANGELVVDDANDATVNITVTPISAAPGVTAPSSQTGATVPFSLLWTGTPTAAGSFVYEVTVADGTNSPTFTVTIDASNPAPTLTPATGSTFNIGRTVNVLLGAPLVNAELVADDANGGTVDITVTPVSPAPSVTAPSSQTGVNVPASLIWSGTPGAVGAFTYDVTLSDGVNSPVFTVTIIVTNPPPTLAPATGSGFNVSRVYSATQNIALANAELIANDQNDATVNITVTPVSAAPGVTAPSSQTGAAVPFSLIWTGAPTASGTFTYDVTVSDGTNSPTFTVTIIVTNPTPTLNPATGSGFNASRVYSGAQGTALSVADLVADDSNDPLISITVTPVTPAPGVTAPASQVNVAAPATLSWTGTPTSAGTFTYNVQVSDGVSSPTFTVTFNIIFAGTITVANGNPGSAFNYGSLGAVFDALETIGMGGPVVVEMYDDGGNFVVDDSYRLGVVGSTITLAPVAGLSATNTLTIRAATGETPVISGNCLSTYSTSATEIGTMAFRNVGNITLEGLTFTGGTYYGVMWYASATGSADNLVIRGCKFHGISFGSAVYMYGSSTTTGPNNVLIENNFCWNVNGDGSGIGGGTTGGPRGVIGARRIGSNFVARHNTILLNSTGATASAFYTNGSTTPMADVSYNVVYITTAATATFYNKDTSAVPPTLADRNVVFLGGSAAMVNDATLSTWAQWQASGRDANGLNTDPLLVNINSGTEDLHLQPTSPAINLAVGTAATVDIDGDTRPIGGVADSGADEALVPEIEVLEGTNNVADGGIYNVGNVATTTGMAVTFTINNQGASDLLLTGATTVVATILNNLDPASGVQTQPAITTIPAAGNSTFVVFLDPTITGYFSMSISIDNNDLNENPFNFTVEGTAFTPNGEAQANTATGSSLSGGTNGPFTIAVDPGTVLANVEIELTDPETDTITVNSITLLTAAPTGITAPAVPAPGQPILLAWTGTADASNAPGSYTWQVSFADAVNQTVITADVTITINNLAPQHVIAAATSGDGSSGNPYTAAYTATMGASADIDVASVSDPNTSQALFLGTITLGGANPAGGNGFTFSVAGGFLNVAPTSVLVAADVGVHTFNVEVTDGSLATTIAVSITVAAAPVYVTVSPLTDGEQGIAYSFQLVVNGGTPALAFTVASGTLPPGVGLNASGLLSGTPTLSGVYTFDITATDSLGVGVTGSFQITVDPPATGNPTITTTSPLPTGTQDAVYAPVSITATGGTGTYSFAVTGGTLPPGLSLSAAGVVSGTPTLAGTYAFDITVTDTAFATDTDAFQMVINPPPVVGSGGGGGGGGGCVGGGTGNSPWLLLVLIGTLLVVLRLRKAHE